MFAVMKVGIAGGNHGQDRYYMRLDPNGSLAREAVSAFAGDRRTMGRGD